MTKLSTVDSINISNDHKLDESVLNPTIPTVTVETKYDFPTEIVQLPSRGLLYPQDNPLHSGVVEMKYMTAKEEDILSTQSYITQGVVLDKLFESMIVTPGVKYDDLLIGDKNAILFAARVYGYGPAYETVVTTDTGTSIPVAINLSELPHKQFDDSLITPGVNRFRYTLPTSKVEIEFKLLTVGDQKKIDADLRGMKKSPAFKQTASANLTTRLRFMIMSVNGNSDTSNINKFINNMLAIDSRAFREYVATIQPDVDLGVEVEDPETGEPFRGNFTIGLDLFYPDYKK
jgi:hypothetical protein